METDAHPQAAQSATSERYETTDPNVRGIVIFLGVVAGLVLMAYFGATLFFRRLLDRAEQADQQTRQAQVAAVTGSRAYFPSPREQISPREDLRELRAREGEELNTYGWIDRKAGVVRIPINRAMDLMVQRGLPAPNSTNGSNAGPSNLQLQQERATQSAPVGKEAK